jgi:hypothetical protein
MSTPLADFIQRHGRYLWWPKATPEQRDFMGKPQFQVGQTVVVLNPWWLRNRAGEQLQPRARCVIVEPVDFWSSQNDHNRYGAGYSVTVKPDQSFAHARNVKECDLEGFVPNPRYPPK